RGRPEEALESGRESVQRLSALQAAAPGEHTAWLAGALDTLAAALAASGEEDRAFTTSGEAVARAREAYADNPSGVGDMLAGVLVACAERHREHRRDAALTWADEAVEVLG